MTMRKGKSVLASVYYMFPVMFKEGGRPCRPCHQNCYVSPGPTLALSMKVGVSGSDQQGVSFPLVMVLMPSVLAQGAG